MKARPLKNEYDFKNFGFMNMDRGTMGQIEGKNYGVVCDGSGSGKEVLESAQAFTESIEKSIREGGFNKIEDKHLQTLAETVFQTAAASRKQDEAYGNAATAVFATFAEISDVEAPYRVQGAAIGDAIAISISRKSGIAYQLNNIIKKDPTDHKDSGGAIQAPALTDGDMKKISTFSHPIGLDDIVILASDGLADNIYQGNTEELKKMNCEQQRDEMKEQLELALPQIIFNSKFDLPFDELRREKQFWLDKKSPRLPTAQDLQRFGKNIS